VIQNDDVRTPSIIFHPISTGISYNEGYDSTHLMRDLDNAGEDCYIAIRIDPRDADADYWTAGLQIALAGGSPRLEAAVTYDSGASNRSLFFTITYYDPPPGSESYKTQVYYGAALDSDDWPMDLMIKRINTGTIPEFQAWYRICSSSGWGAWTEFSFPAAPQDCWDLNSEDQTVTLHAGPFGYTFGAANKGVKFSDFEVGDPDTSTMEGHLADKEIVWAANDALRTNAWWKLDEFECSPTERIQWAYDVNQTGTPSWSAWKTTAEMQALSMEQGRYFHLKAKLVPDGGDPATTMRGPDDYAFDYDPGNTPWFGWAALPFGVAPTFTFEGSPTSGDAPLAVQFTPDFPTPVMGVKWEFGDGDTSAEFAPEHTYDDPGMYSVKLTAWDEDGPGQARRLDYITVEGSPTGFVADFEGSPIEGYAPLRVVFTDASNRTVNEVSWTFGDGHYGDRFNPSHVYMDEGSYTVSYHAWDMSEASDTETKVNYIVVTTRPTLPGAAFDWESSPPSDGGRVPYKVLFTDKSSGSPTGWLWDFGDETSPSTDQNPAHTYSSAGRFDVMLEATNANGSDDMTYEGLITVVESSPVTSNLDPDASYGRSVWHIPMGDELEADNWEAVTDVKHVEFTLLREGGCGSGRLTVAREWADRAEINVGDSIAVMHHTIPDPENPPVENPVWGYEAWYLGYVDEVRADIMAGTVDYVLVGYGRHLSDTYPGENDEDDSPAFYCSKTTLETEIDPDDPMVWEQHIHEEKVKISEIVLDLYDRYLLPLGIFPEGVDADIDETPDESDLKYLKLEGERNLADVLEMLGRLAGGYTWGIDVEEAWSSGGGGRRRLSLFLPGIKDQATAQQFADWFFSQYARPAKFLNLKQLGSEKRIAPWRRWYPIGVSEEAPRGGLLELKDSGAELMGVYDYQECRCVFNECAEWTIAVGPRNPLLRVGASGAAEFYHPKLAGFAGFMRTSRDEKYKVVFMGFAKVMQEDEPDNEEGWAGEWQEDKKEYLYTILPTKTPMGESEENAKKIHGVHNIMSLHLFPDAKGRTVSRFNAGEQVAYYRGWDIKKKEEYYFISEPAMKVACYAHKVDKGSCKEWEEEVEVPEDSALYIGLTEWGEAMLSRAWVGGPSENYWHVDVSWQYRREEPKMFLKGRTLKGEVRATGYHVNVLLMGYPPKRSDLL